MQVAGDRGPFDCDGKACPSDTVDCGYLSIACTTGRGDAMIGGLRQLQLLCMSPGSLAQLANFFELILAWHAGELKEILKMCPADGMFTKEVSLL